MPEVNPQDLPDVVHRMIRIDADLNESAIRPLSYTVSHRDFLALDRAGLLHRRADDGRRVLFPRFNGVPVTVDSPGHPGRIYVELGLK